MYEEQPGAAAKDKTRSDWFKLNKTDKAAHGRESTGRKIVMRPVGWGGGGAGEGVRPQIHVWLLPELTKPRAQNTRGSLRALSARLRWQVYTPTHTFTHVGVRYADFWL